jgi:hypothetical protein
MENPRSSLLILGLTNLGRTLLGEKGTKSPVGCGELEHGFEPSTPLHRVSFRVGLKYSCYLNL